MREINRPTEITVENSTGRTSLRERLSGKIKFMRTAAGGVPKDAWPKKTGPHLGSVPEHPNI